MISLHYTSHTKAYNTIYTACNIVEAIYSFTLSAALAVRLPKRVVSYAWRNIHSIDTVAFEDDLRKSVVFSEPATDVDTYVDQLNNVLTELLDMHAPVRTTRRRPPKRISRWLSDEAVAAKRLRRHLERRWRNTGLEADRVKYRLACRDANRLINCSRTEHFRCRIEATGGDWKKRWRVVNELLQFILMIQTNPELMLRTVTCLNRSLSILSAK